MNNNGFKDIKPDRTAIKAPENNKHDRMKLFARKLLFYMGIPSSNIFEEISIDVNGKNYRVDLVGYPSKYSESLAIAIECGDNKAEKIEALRNKFALVLILPYKEFDILEQPELKVIQKMTKDLEQQAISNYHYLKEIQDTEKRFNETKTALDTKIEQAGKQVTLQIETSFKKRFDDIDTKIKVYENELNCLREFKNWCAKFGEIRY